MRPRSVSPALVDECHGLSERLILECLEGVWRATQTRLALRYQEVRRLGCLRSYATGRFERMRQIGRQWEYSRSPAAATASKVAWLPHTNDALRDSLWAGPHDLDKEDGLPLTAWHESIVIRGPPDSANEWCAYGFWVRRRMRAIRISPLGASRGLLLPGLVHKQ